MPKDTKIGWTEATWNPFSGCVKVSPGCNNCYAETLAEQRRGTKAFPNGFDLTLRPHKLSEPKKWAAPREIFVNSTSDLFLGTVPLEYMSAIFSVMLDTPRHTYQIPTKRPVPALRIMQELDVLPLPPHIWIGASVENQRWADERIPQLLNIPAAMRFLSCEPLLGPLDIYAWLAMRVIDWVIDGGESGPGRRLAQMKWFLDIRDQCVAAGVPYFHKQGNAFRPGQDRLLEGRIWDQHPNRLKTTLTS